MKELGGREGGMDGREGALKRKVERGLERRRDYETSKTKYL
jgi:hypothetical protein